MARVRRKKKRTHRVEHVDPSKKGVPSTFVFRMGKHRSLVKDLEADFKRVMMPHTAPRLRVSRNNVMKDFVHVAGPLGVSHFVIFTATENASYMRVCKSPRGPTLTLKVREYSLIRDVQASLARPRMPDAAFQHAPLVVLSGFGQEDHMKLTAVMFQNMFPAINVTQARLSDCQRVVLLTYNKGTGTLSFRHYSIAVTPSGISKGVKALVQRKGVPDLSKFTDVADFVERSGYGSESEGEDAAASRVTLAETLGRGNLAQRTSRIKLHEIGPRLELEVVKVQEGLAEGRVLHHSYVKRTPEEVAGKELEIAEAARLKAERRRIQEENVRKKAKEAARQALAAEAQKQKKRKREEEAGAQAKARNSGGKKPWWEEDAGPELADNDAEYYRAEVGEEPDAASGALRAGKSDKSRPAVDKEVASGRPPRSQGTQSASFAGDVPKGRPSRHKRAAGARQEKVQADASKRLLKGRGHTKKPPSQRTGRGGGGRKPAR